MVLQKNNPLDIQGSSHYEASEMDDNTTINEASPLIDSRTGKRWNWWERPSDATPKLQHLVLGERRSSIHGKPSNGMGTSAR